MSTCSSPQVLQAQKWPSEGGWLLPQEEHSCTVHSGNQNSWSINPGQLQEESSGYPRLFSAQTFPQLEQPEMVVRCGHVHGPLRRSLQLPRCQCKWSM